MIKITTKILKSKPTLNMPPSCIAFFKRLLLLLLLLFSALFPSTKSENTDKKLGFKMTTPFLPLTQSLKLSQTTLPYQATTSRQPPIFITDQLNNNDNIEQVSSVTKLYDGPSFNPDDKDGLEGYQNYPTDIQQWSFDRKPNREKKKTYNQEERLIKPSEHLKSFQKPRLGSREKDTNATLGLKYKNSSSSLSAFRPQNDESIPPQRIVIEEEREQQSECPPLLMFKELEWHEKSRVVTAFLPYMVSRQIFFTRTKMIKDRMKEFK